MSIRSNILALVAVGLSPFRPRGPKRVVLYGPKLNGNLKAFVDYVERTGVDNGHYVIAYAAPDPQYCREVSAAHPSLRVLCTTNLKDMVEIGQASAVITSHFLDNLAILNALTTIKFINVWHGIGWKGHVPNDFAFLARYADNWVTSPAFKRIYEHDFGIKSPVHVTGYARTDDAVRGNFSAEAIKKRYGISPSFGKIILFAPTWAQDHGRHSLFPFGTTAEQFLAGLNAAGRACNGLVIVRTHLNSGDITMPDGLDNIAFMPSNTYPVTEDFLAVADVLITDWSSVVFDFLPLGRPIIFLDTPVPFERLCFDASYRFGEIVASLPRLNKVISEYAVRPGRYQEAHAALIKKAIQLGYDTTLDGRSAERYHRRLLELIEPAAS
ncbi:MAG TPA: CDP-glycerol glycerophosphotransferase family protein [Candidatus Saccharimonadia bacterium]|jgi:CDP-glycerol glycerophosphotransferase|nr:CDP-glycerol glycerophosphotransferase family protein [Candidatus Saccharimonadia bacterium]